MLHRELQEYISARSLALWEREGREPGREDEYWERARAEVEQELMQALAGEQTNFVPPHLSISSRPVRSS